MKNHFNNLPSFLLGCLLTLVFCGILYLLGSEKPSLIAAIDNRTMDIMFKVRGPLPDSGQVVIVDIDEKSLNRLGQWPWSRNVLARMTRNMVQNQVRAIGFDIVFAEADRTSPALFLQQLDTLLGKKIPDRLLSDLKQDPSLDYDAVFADILSSGPTILGYGFQLGNDGLKRKEDLPFPSGVIRIKPEQLNFEDLSLIPAYRAVINHPSVAMAQSEGFINVLTDDSGTARQVPLFMIMDSIPYPSLALEVYRVGMGIEGVTIHASEEIKTRKRPVLGIHLGDQFVPTDSLGQIFVNYRGPEGSFESISAVDVLESSSLPALKDKFVIVGSSATGLFDIKATPFSSAVPGIEINATIVDNLIRSDSFTYDRLTEIGLNYTLIFMGGLLLSLILSFAGPLTGSLGALAFFGGSLLWNYSYFFLNHRHIGISYPMFSCAAILLAISVFNAFREGRSKRFIQKAFSHYVSPDVVAELLKNPSALSLTGEDRELTVMFCDIRGFTSISETMNSQDLGDFMNDFLTRLSRVIMANGGTVDKFIGDAIMAFWGAPKEDPDHAFNAVLTALQFRQELMDLHQAHRQTIPEIVVGVGINTGQVSVGNFGSKHRFDYTVMGDNVNLASRLEGANKNYGTTILISETTRNLIADAFFCRFIDKVRVKGRQEPVNLYEPLCQGEPARPVRIEAEVFEKGVKAYQNQAFVKAEQIITELNKSNPCLLYQSYLDRIRGFAESPPPPSWNGVERREHLTVNRLKTK